MLLKSILKKAVRYVQEHPNEHGSRLIKLAANGQSMTVSDFLMKLDVQDVTVLRDYVPKAFPKHLRHPIEICVSKNIHDKWRVDPVEK
jgi:hypothetical protein